VFHTDVVRNGLPVAHRAVTVAATVAAAAAAATATDAAAVTFNG
jgi:hypothetical protein